MTARIRFASIVLAGLLLLVVSATRSGAQAPPGISSGGAMRRADSGSGAWLRDRHLLGRIGGFVGWATPRWLPGAGRPTRTFESTLVRPASRPWPRLGRSRLP